MEDRIVVRNIGMAIGVIILVAFALITISTVVGSGF
jgi:hypothetical protein